MRYENNLKVKSYLQQQGNIFDVFKNPLFFGESTWKREGIFGPSLFPLHLCWSDDAPLL